MSEKTLIERAREIQRELYAELEESKQLGFRVEDFEQRGRYIHYLKSGSPIRSKDIFSSYTPETPEINLYIHIPFCIDKCTFCRSFSVGTQPRKIVEEYIDSLKKEIEIVIRKPRFRNAAVRYIYFGGGTPTYLSAKQLADLVGYLKGRLNVLPNANFTCETSPEMFVGRAGKNRIQVLLESGVNRVSIGVQSFDDSILKLIGRKHSAETAISAYQNAHEAGVPNINMDLMFGLPLQTPERWENDLEILTDLSPGYASVYRLRLENPKLHTTYMKEPHLFPDRETVLLMNIMAVEKLTDAGYRQSEAPSTFLLPYRSSYHTPYHGLCAEELGIGTAAWSYLSGVRYHNYHDLKRYMMCVNNGRLPIAFAGKYSQRQQIERETIRMLRAPEGVNRSDFNTRFGIPVEKLFDEPLQKLIRTGFITDDGQSYKLSYKGLLFTVEVFKEFYSQDLVTIPKDVIYSNQFLKHYFLKKKWSKSVEAISRITKTVAGYAR